MPGSRSISRNVWIEFASDPGVIRGGLCAADNLTRAQFLEMVGIAFEASGGFRARHSGSGSNNPIAPTNQPLQHGRYILIPSVPGEVMRTSNERFSLRALSSSNTPRDVEFRNQVRQRDRRCVITGRINLDAPADRWIGFEAAHIFPLALDDIFTSQGFSQLITYNNSSGSGINSPQNGILLRSDVHQLWDDYSIAVNPVDNYRIQSFSPSAWDYHGRTLEFVCRDPNNSLSVIDALLHWHYKQAVLCNMRGEGEASFEFDFPPGSDSVGEIREGPRPAERMEAELFNRLHAWEEEKP